MATYNTKNDLGSTDPRDLLDNAQIADHYISDVGNESWNDRFGNKRKTWKGIENESESQLTAQENSFQQFLLNSGYEQLADYTDGPFTFTSRNQITAYNGEFYRPKASVSLPYTTTGNTATTWETDKNNFVAVGDAALRQELDNATGPYSTLRAYRGPRSFFDTLGYSSIFDGGEGRFILDESDTTTADNDCTVIVDALGRRWKRQYDGNIQAKWAGIKYVDETDDAQDAAFSNLLKACAVDSPTGYPNKIIEDLSGRRIKLSKRYFIRGGVYNNNDTVGNTLHNRSARFGINASFVFDGSAGFVLLQMINPVIKMVVDNSDVTLATAPTINDYALRCECLVISPDIDIKVSQYTGTAYYQLGKYRTTDEFSSMWSDLTLSGTSNYGGITNLNGGSINIASCGRGFYWKAGGAGMGHITSVWEQNCTNPSYFYDLQDFTFTSFETYVATVATDSITKAGDYFEQCGGHFGKLLAGQGGLPNVAFFGGSTVDIDHAFLVCGSAQGVFDNVSQTGMEVYDSVVMIGSAEVYHPNGRGFVIGGASYVSIGSMLGKFPWQCVALGNDYITCVSGVTNNTSDARCIVNGFNIVRGNNSAYVTSSRPQFEISKNLIEFGGLSLSNGKFENVNNGFSDQSDQYVIRCNSDAAGALSIDNVKFSRINYPIYCNNPDNITKFIGNDFDNSKIYYQDGTSTNVGGRESPQGAFVTYFTGLKVGGSWQYWGKCPLRFSCRLTITTASATSILINGREVFYANETGHYSFTCALQYGDLISCTGTTANASVSGAMITFVRNIY